MYNSKSNDIGGRGGFGRLGHGDTEYYDLPKQVSALKGVKIVQVTVRLNFVKINLFKSIV